MGNNLVIVESPAKAKTIEKFLGKEYVVKSSMGHVRDLSKKDFGVDIKKGFAPDYIVPDEKKKVVSELKADALKASQVWLATDEDREGEAIAWHLAEVLQLDLKKTKRIVFHEITKNAILDAINNPRGIDLNLVNAQQARRVLDRIVGFEISPILWRKVKPSLSAGRVQSVAVRLIVEREREINQFVSTSAFRTIGHFMVTDNNPSQGIQIKAELQPRFAKKEEALHFLDLCNDALFTVADVQTKPARKSPSPPFTTSTLQQEASRKLGYSVAQTMMVAQKLYESGKITYMRTDSVNLSQLALNSAKTVIGKEYGEAYINIRTYKTKAKGAQEAHEAIRPTDISKMETEGTAQEKRLYELIWKRTIASQMSDARLEKTSIAIALSNSPHQFLATGEVLKFDGFLKVYLESTDDEPEAGEGGQLPPVSTGDKLVYKTIESVEKYSHHPPRYTEASLVRKMEELGIGRPSTYAPTISTIQNRGYILKIDKPGDERQIMALLLEGGKVEEKLRTEIYGAEKNKLIPDSIGFLVNDFLVRYFQDILDYNFTANIELEFDSIALGEKVWNEVIGLFYKHFHPKVENTLKESEYIKGERLLGNDPQSGLPVIVKMGRYGAYAQIGQTSENEDVAKPKYASMRRGQSLETITLEEALQLFRLPRAVGEYEGHEMVVGVGRFGPYVRHNGQFYSLKKGVDDPFEISSERAIELIEEKRLAEKNRVVKEFPEEAGLKILNGRWGPYLSNGKENFRIPKGTDAAKLTYKQVQEIMKKQATPKKPATKKQARKR